jgi:TonB family protein
MMVTILSETIVRSSVIVALCGLAALLFRSRSAEIRHFIWCGALYSLLLLPPLQFAMVPRTWAMPYARTITALYLAALLMLLVRFLLAVSYVRGIVRRSEAIFDPDLRELVHESWLQSLSRYRPEVRLSREVCVPMTAGVHESCILLPASCIRWPREKLHAVLLHELAHVRRGDPAIAFLSSLVVCLFWIHPFVYWLRRQLAALAEEACDQAALERMDPARYARILVEFVTALPASGSRILPVCSVAVHRSQVKRRIEKIFSIGARPKATYGWLRAVLLITFVPVFYVAGASRFEVQDVTDKVVVNDEEQARAAEVDLQQHPENLQEREALMAFYANHGDESGFTKQLLWMIEHHPEAPVTTIRFYPRPPWTESQEDHQRIRDAWGQALATHSASPDVIFHAGLFMEQDDPVRALMLLRQAQGMVTDPQRQARYFDAIAWLYSLAVLRDLHANDPRFQVGPAIDLSAAIVLRAEVESSTDPALLSKTGTHLVQMNEDAVGLSYLQKAIDLDPSSPAWKEALESAKVESIRRQNRQELSAPVQIGAGVAGANLLTKVEPQYPPLAQQARVQGSVEFTVDIGPDGHVKNIRLVRGHPLLVNAAKDAVLQYVYRPTLLNGKPVAVRTTVVVPFRLP